jgi:hypothetical protein
MAAWLQIFGIGRELRLGLLWRGQLWLGERSEAWVGERVLGAERGGECSNGAS